ncbi:hypothetical protein GCK72_004175 [Caenorhabditis remanei]|uniref:Receptor L-domain domain-containing protein n=1 Tax=Caenorhabditis remanei TaxID=31234 RepID=A0A6A5H909_CAERE|nr:hypothetical protein GCK72_004175 [Caenorhabditis remanei]KAF1764228.1 hypothetical protein GCK72_004175 [Caenorhabditis remanei]
MYGFYIRNNSLLTDISTLYKFYLWGDENYKECDFRVENNAKLDVQKLYEDNVGLHYLEMRSSGNLRDFGCRGDEITSSNLPFYQNCTFFFGGLKLHNLTDQFDISYLSNVRTIIGSIDIQNTSLKDLSFMKNIELVQINNVGLEERVAFNIQNNARMTRFALFNLDIAHVWPGSTIANIENLHPDFCFTIEEILKISYLKFVNLHAKFCEETGNLAGSILCRFDKLSNLDDNCNKILGDVLIEGGDEEYVSKLGDVWNIFGSVTIRNTKLKNFDFFHYLSYIISLDEDQPLIEISGNGELEKAYFPAIVTTVSRSPTPIIIENNHPKMFNSSKFYLLFPQVPAKSIYPTTEYKTPPK